MKLEEALMLYDYVKHEDWPSHVSVKDVMKYMIPVNQAISSDWRGTNGDGLILEELRETVKELTQLIREKDKEIRRLHSDLAKKHKLERCSVLSARVRQIRYRNKG